MYKLFITGDVGFEFWKDIPGYEGRYQASTYGRIRSLDRVDSLGRFHKGQVMSVFHSPKIGYEYVRLKANGKGHTFYVHKLVAMTFLPCSYLPCIDHKDTDRSNNNVANLRYTTPTGNNHNPLSLQKYKDTKKDKEKNTYIYTTNGVLVGVYPCFNEAVAGTGCNRGSAWRVLTGKQKQTRGLVFRYEPLN